VAATLEIRGEEGLDDRACLVGSQPPPREREDVGVVVAAAHLGFFGVVRVDRTDAVDLVGHDGYPDSRAADDHRTLGLPVRDHASRVGGVARIVR